MTIKIKYIPSQDSVWVSRESESLHWDLSPAQENRQILEQQRFNEVIIDRMEREQFDE